MMMLVPLPAVFVVRVVSDAIVFCRTPSMYDRMSVVSYVSAKCRHAVVSAFPGVVAWSAVPAANAACRIAFHWFAVAAVKRPSVEPPSAPVGPQLTAKRSEPALLVNRVRAQMVCAARRFGAPAGASSMNQSPPVLLVLLQRSEMTTSRLENRHARTSLR